MRPTLLAPLLALFLTGCAGMPDMSSHGDSGPSQVVAIEAVDQAGNPVIGAECTLGNDRGQWTLTAPGATRVGRSLAPLAITCARDGLVGALMLTTDTQKFGCGTASLCAYPGLARVSLREPNPVGSPPGRASLKVSGHGAPPRDESMSAGQRRLMAMRASKLDAYRALAEQLHGVRVNGNSTVADMVIRGDSFRVHVDAWLRGARELGTTSHPDGSIETELELVLDQAFFDGFRGRAGCGGQTTCAESGRAGCAPTGAIGPGCAYPDGNFYLAR